jgi:hypothetical protein
VPEEKKNSLYIDTQEREDKEPLGSFLELRAPCFDKQRNMGLPLLIKALGA